MGRLGVLKRSALVVLACAWAGGCSWLVDDNPDPVGCSAEGQIGPPACADGYACRAGACVRCSGDCAVAGSAGEAGAPAAQ